MSRDLKSRLTKLENHRPMAELAPFIPRHGVPVLRSQEEAAAWRAQSPLTRWPGVLVLQEPRTVTA